MEFVGDYQYRRSDIIGHGAFAVVFRGSSRLVSKFCVFFCVSGCSCRTMRLASPVNRSYGLMEIVSRSVVESVNSLCSLWPPSRGGHYILQPWFFL